MNDGLHRILCAEDDPDIRTILEFSLGVLGGYELCLCADGTDALARADAFAPDLILLDVMMPTLSGPETMRALREKPALRDTPCVLMSARAMPSEIEALLEHGATGVIVKPFDPVKLPENLKIYWDYARDKLASRTRPAGSESAQAPESEADASFARLRARFVAGLAERHAALSAAWDAFAAEPGTPSPRGALAGTLHRLAGAAGGYGFDELGEKARALEAEVRGGAASDTVAAPFAKLLAALADAAATTPPADPAEPSDG